MSAVTLSRLPGYRGSELTLDIDPAEHERRRPFWQRHIDSPDVLDLLMALPVGEPVPCQSLTARQQDAVCRAPVGVLDLGSLLTEDPAVTRLAVRPCRVSMATVRSATACATALGSAARFAPFCARQVIARRRPKSADTLIEYGFYGVGLLLDNGDGELDTLVGPAPWRPLRHTAAGWRFAETAYAAHLASSQEVQQ